MVKCSREMGKVGETEHMDCTEYEVSVLAIAG